MGINNNRLVTQERRNKVWTLITKGMKRYQIAQELNVDPGTISRDIKHLTEQSRDYLNSLARQTLPFMYQTSIDGIKQVLKECWNIYESTAANNNNNNFQKLAALKLAKECHEAQFKLLNEAPRLMTVQTLEEKLRQLESYRQIH